MLPIQDALEIDQEHRARHQTLAAHRPRLSWSWAVVVVSELFQKMNELT